MQVFLIPVLEDNYIFVLHDPESTKTAVIDPGQSAPVQTFLEQKGFSLDEIWITHHHWDHVGGILELKELYQATVRCHDLDRKRIPGHDITHKSEDTFAFGEETVLVKKLDGHTIGHIAFYLARPGILFSGDTIFAMGCGRLFEGTAEQMFQSLQWIAQLPEETQIYCTHEYTLDNARFSADLLPSDLNIKQRLSEIQKTRQRDLPTIPTTVKIEIATNPFLKAKDWQEFAAYRKAKDNF